MNEGLTFLPIIPNMKGNETCSKHPQKRLNG